MFRLTNSIRHLQISREALSLNYANLQSVRWRKPRWFPIAKSKIFRVPPRCNTPEDELLELRRLYNNYNNNARSVRMFLFSKHCTKFMASEDPEKQREIFEEDYRKCLEINNKWNEEQRVLREQRVAKELEDELEFARKRIEVEKMKKEEKIEEVDSLVRSLKADAKNFITAENIDQAIEHALANPVDFNFAIDINGNKIEGRETSPPEVPSEKIGIKQ